MSAKLPVLKHGFPALSLLAFFLSAGHATSADFGQPYDYSRRSIDRSPRYGAVSPVYRPQIWEGLYLGGSLGLDFGANGTSSDVGFATGVHGGYNWQLGSFVAGIELDGSLKWADAARGASGAFTADVQQDWVSSMRLRLGYAPGAALYYLTGGFAVGNLDVGLSGPGYSSRKNELIGGYALGAGVEFKLAPTLSGRLEALHYGFGEETFRFSAGTVKTDADFTTIRAGLTWHFN